MKKSVYSLVLMDEVIDAIDEMAYRMNTSRSNLINQILAEKVSMMTPEMRMKEIFDRLEKLMDSRFQMLAQPSDSMMSIRSPLKYRYKPTIKYSVELNRTFQGTFGRLKVSFRTQSVQFIRALQGFFAIWQQVESSHLGGIYPDGVPCRYGESEFMRDFSGRGGETPSESEIAEGIGAYISLVDECIKIYFSENGGRDAAGLIGEKYRDFLAAGHKII